MARKHTGPALCNTIAVAAERQQATIRIVEVLGNRILDGTVLESIAPAEVVEETMGVCSHCDSSQCCRLRDSWTARLAGLNPTRFTLLGSAPKIPLIPVKTISTVCRLDGEASENGGRGRSSWSFPDQTLRPDFRLVRTISYLLWIRGSANRFGTSRK